MTDELTDRQIAHRLIAQAIHTLSNGAAHIRDMSDGPVMRDQLDLMEDEVEGADSMTPMNDLHEIAQDCAVEILLDAGFPI
ncbi:hypothetical protein N9955_00670 [bacterium]|nr:hypothetical protein [bacterium]